MTTLLTLITPQNDYSSIYSCLMDRSSLTILSEEQKFNGENLLKWNITMTQLLGSKGLLGYTDGKIVKPTQPTPDAITPDSTPIYSTNSNFNEWTFCDQLAQGHVTLNCSDIA